MIFCKQSEKHHFSQEKVSRFTLKFVISEIILVEHSFPFSGQTSLLICRVFLGTCCTWECALIFAQVALTFV